ncbi:MAG: VanZ family protein [Cellvibrionales bacterium]|nr:MAG: VanZ family protein [Cellvibrionales bacterium]
MKRIARRAVCLPLTRCCMSPLANKLFRIPLLAWQTVFWLLWLAATAVMLLPASNLPSVNIWDKAEHAATFAVLMVLAWFAYQYRFSVQKLATWLVCYGIVIECIQHFVPTRSFSVLDMVADSMGVAVIFLFLRRIKTS